MYNAFWRPFSVKTFDRSRNGYQVTRLRVENDFRGSSGQALPLPSRVSFSSALFFLVATTSKRLLRRLDWCGCSDESVCAYS